MRATKERQKALAPAAGWQEGTEKVHSSVREDNPGSTQGLAPQIVLSARTRLLGPSRDNEEGSLPWDDPSPGPDLPALLDLRDLAIVRDDLRPQGPTLPQPVRFAHSAASPLTPPTAP
uniref:Uncharacterized protein n=1 Tax=Mus musculus TaxID=10090 RepID=Q8C672_MOUSE|nr:unnamed protein product [Mus musculus]